MHMLAFSLPVKCQGLNLSEISGPLQTLSVQGTDYFSPAMQPAHHRKSPDGHPSCLSVWGARGPQSGTPLGSSSKLNGCESKGTENYVFLYFIGCLVPLIQRKVPWYIQLLLLLRLEKPPEEGQSMAPLRGSSLTRPFLPVVLPNVSGLKLPPMASPGLEPLPPSSIMPHVAGGTARVSSPLRCHSLSFGAHSPTLTTLLSRIPWSLDKLGCPAHQT